jgi:crotonobetainyl-CoA:carnitine CoA-transferase CaiB-like acyl-CoA transferase
MAGALDDIKVVDLSRVLAGPWSTQNLADLGADVIKIERPGVGDDTRSWGPPFVSHTEGDAQDAAYFFCANRNKRSLTLDFTTDKGREILIKLIAQADVLIENYKVGGLKKYGLDYDSLSRINPRLIYCSITGFGQDGPYADRPGYDALVQAMGGLMSVTGEPDDVPGGGPQKVGVAVVDILTGLYATNAILAALLHRAKSNQGQHIDIALLDVQVAALANQSGNYLLSGSVPQRMGSAHPSIVPYQPFACADGHVMLAIGNDGQFAALCRAAGQAAIANEERFATNAMRVRHRAELIKVLTPLMMQHSVETWCELAQQEGFPCGSINTIDRVFRDPQVCAREMKIQMNSPSYGALDLVASPMRLSASPVSYRRAPPSLGQDTQEVLRDLHYSDDEIASLRDSGVI